MSRHLNASSAIIYESSIYHWLVLNTIGSAKYCFQICSGLFTISNFMVVIDYMLPTFLSSQLKFH